MRSGFPLQLLVKLLKGNLLGAARIAIRNYPRNVIEEKWSNAILEGESQYPTRSLLCPVPLLQALVPHYGLTSDGKCGLTDRAWNLTQGEIYARILLQRVI